MIDLAFILIIILGIVAIIDWKFKQIPSMFLTGILFVTFIIQAFSPTLLNTFYLTSGIAYFIFAWMLYEADFIGGIADIKFLVIIGLMISNFPMILIGILLIMLFGIAYKLVFRFILKRKETEEIPFIPALYSVFVTLYLIGGLA